MLQKLLRNFRGKLLVVMRFSHARVPFHDILSLFCCIAPIYSPAYESGIQGTSEMHEPLPDGGIIRKLWANETDAYRDHLLRLDADSRYRRFSGTVSDEFIARHAATAGEIGVVVHGFLVEGVLRGVAELRRNGSLFAHEGEAAFSVEQPWQSHGVGTLLLERTLLSARNRGITSLQMQCLANNQRMQQLARKFAAGLSFDFDSVVGEVDPAGSTPLSLMREAMADNHGIATAIFEAQSRLFKPA
jgi:GNAT superfamily N-acetyltransferase